MGKSQIYLLALLVTLLVTIAVAVDRIPKKRQIYREQVLPHAGGKIPDTAFETDRLFLNRLQKEGISVPDGVVTEQRNPQVYQYYNKNPRVVFQIALSSDGRYTPSEGRYRHHDTPSIETTYLYPQIHGRLNDASPSKTAYPTYRQLQLHNTQLNQVKLQPKKKTEYLDITPRQKKGHSNPFRTQSYQNFNIINTPIAPTSSAALPGSGSKVDYYVPDVSASAYLFSDFDELFNNFNLHENSAAIKGGDAIFSSKHKIFANINKIYIFKMNTKSVALCSSLLLALVCIAASIAVQVETYGHLFHPPTEEHRREEKQDLSKIPGAPGVDYPIYHEVPHTNFHCANVPAVPGMYANVETGCQAYHVCHDGREGHQGASFLCTNGTIFNQKEFACDWWYNVKCEEAINYYHLNSDPKHNPYFQKKQELEENHNEPEPFYIHA
ncbi:uncharacterized protein LOC129242117 [Anastrepha obliqua]|uniref:uncharacterized protein LOC129242117 n=1 Tax=Anastrepha obliqua TaxID=95512 RepID=UPI00240A92B5|nr:uncharacterized protein LOC129242117 [Anastrepha obliqua]